MSVIQLHRLYQYFGLDPLQASGAVKKKLEYIASFLVDLHPDDQMRYLAKNDVTMGDSVERLSTMWSKLRFSDVSRETVQSMRQTEMVHPNATLDGVTVTPQAPQTMNVTWSPDVKPWSME